MQISDYMNKTAILFWWHQPKMPIIVSILVCKDKV